MQISTRSGNTRRAGYAQQQVRATVRPDFCCATAGLERPGPRALPLILVLVPPPPHRLRPLLHVPILLRLRASLLLLQRILPPTLLTPHPLRPTVTLDLLRMPENM